MEMCTGESAVHPNGRTIEFSDCSRGAETVEIMPQAGPCFDGLMVTR